MCIFTHPKSTFSEDYISALSGCCHLKFLHGFQGPKSSENLAYEGQ